MGVWDASIEARWDLTLAPIRTVAVGCVARYGILWLLDAAGFSTIAGDTHHACSGTVKVTSVSIGEHPGTRSGGLLAEFVVCVIGDASAGAFYRFVTVHEFEGGHIGGIGLAVVGTV